LRAAHAALPPTPLLTPFLALFFACLLLSATGALAQPMPPAGTELHFRDVHAAPEAGALGLQLLTPEERAFVRALPEVRVGVPVPLAQPYEAVAVDGVVSGIHPDMLAALGRAFGIRMKPLLMPSWSATLQAVQRRELDVVMTLGVTPERLKYLEFTLGATPLPGPCLRAAVRQRRHLRRPASRLSATT
jgi:ABC-type amino acid transport substrate-binding protein